MYSKLWSVITSSSAKKSRQTRWNFPMEFSMESKCRMISNSWYFAQVMFVRANSRISTIHFYKVREVVGFAQKYHTRTSRKSTTSTLELAGAAWLSRNGRDYRLASRIANHSLPSTKTSCTILNDRIRARATIEEQFVVEGSNSIRVIWQIYVAQSRDVSW